MAALRNIFYAGDSGLALDLRGTRISHPGIQDVLPSLAALSGRLQKIVDRFPGAWLEGKMAGLTVHYREFARAQIPDLQSQIGDAAQPFRDRMRFTDGPKAIEIVPELGWDKGTAVKFILEHLGQDDLLPLYAGDAPNDDAAFEIVAEMGGVCIGVGAKPPLAHCCVADPAALLSFLAALDRNLAAEEPGGMRTAAHSLALLRHRQSIPSTYRM